MEGRAQPSCNKTRGDKKVDSHLMLKPGAMSVSVLNSLSRGVSEQPTHDTVAFVVVSSTKGVPGMNPEV